MRTHPMTYFIRVLVVWVVVLMAGCSPEPRDLDEQLAELEATIRQMIGEASCTTALQCRAIAFGNKPCGGPWEYLIYSTEDTDPQQFATLVETYYRLEGELNFQEGRVSDCEVPDFPLVVCEEQRCQGR